jgi:putative CocE/NonD family hydrolase
VVLTYATGENHWNASSRWPAGAPVKLYLREHFGLSFEPPAAAADTGANQKDNDRDSYVSDPSKPIPFTPRPIHMNDEAQWQTWLVQDQRFASARPDVLVYEGPVLDKPVHIMGPPQVDLFAATSGTDSDFAVKLIDVYPDFAPEPEQTTTAGFAELSGSEVPIGIEIFRGRYVHGFDKPQPLTPGKVEEYRFGLPSVDHVFLRGHRIMVQVQSTLFPLYDRNPQTWVDNIFYAKPGDYRPATQSVYHSAAAASAIVLPVVPAARPNSPAR